MYKTEYQDLIIQRVKKLRLQNNISQAELGVIMGLSSGHISNIESPKYPHKYSLKQLKIFCDHIDFDMVNLFLGNSANCDNHELLTKIIQYDERKSNC